MFSDSYRREVAGGIRQFLSMPRDEQVWDNDGLQTVGRLVGTSVGENILVRLADLIDRPATTRHGKFKTKYGRKTPCCEVCGYSIGDMRWSYCPQCGAMIADD